MKVLGPNTDAQDAIPRGLARLRVNAPTYFSSGNLTLSAADSGNVFVYNGTAGSNVTITFPTTLPDGFTCKIENAGTGTVTFVFTGFVHFGNAGRTGLAFQWDVADIAIYTATGAGVRVFDTTYNLALPVLYAENTAAETRNVATLSALAGLTIPLEAVCAYDVNILIPYTCGVTTNALRVGMLAWPSGSTGQFEVSIWNAVAAGTAPKTNHFWPTSALAVTGTAGTASVVGSTMLASVTGRIKTSSTAGNLAVAVGALTTTGAVSIAANAASMSVSKVYDQART